MQNKKIDEKINIGIKEIKQIKMNIAERKLMLSNILNSPHLSDTRIKSPWSFVSFINNLQKNQLIYYGFISCLIIISGSGVVFAYQKSLPGNILYPLKVEVMEPIYSNLMLSKESKAKYESSLATERMIEAENLANQNKLDDIKEKQLNDLLINHTETLNKTLSELPQNESSENDIKDDIINDFQNKMNMHALTLDNIIEQNNINNIEIKEMQKKEDSEKDDENDIQISETARDSANKIRNESETENFEDEQNKESQQERKEKD